ncbi:MAG: alpha/beta hydrolase family protein [Phycisphaerales bacterium]
MHTPRATLIPLLLPFLLIFCFTTPAARAAQTDHPDHYNPLAALCESSPPFEITLQIPATNPNPNTNTNPNTPRRAPQPNHPDQPQTRPLLLTVRIPLDPTPTSPTNTNNTAEPTPRPLIIFSHGAGGSGQAFEDLSRSLAQRGFIVIHPWHSDSEALRRRTNEAPAYDRARGPEQLVERVNLMERLAETRAITEHIAELQAAINNHPTAAPIHPIAIDPERIGMAGHSAGAMTTQAAAGLRFFPPRAPRTENTEPRGIANPITAISAFAIISGQGTTRPSINEHSWQDITAPTLTIAGTEDRSVVSDETPESRRHPFEHAPATGNRYLLYIDGATHSSYQGPSTRTPRTEPAPANAEWIERTTTATVIAFMEAHITQDPDALAWLRTNPAQRTPGGTAQWLTK